MQLKMKHDFNRQKAARLAQQLLREEITYNHFVDEYPEDTHDKDIDILFDLIEHQPKRGGILGVNDKDYQHHIDKIQTIIQILES